MMRCAVATLTVPKHSCLDISRDRRRCRGTRPRHGRETRMNHVTRRHVGTSGLHGGLTLVQFLNGSPPCQLLHWSYGAEKISDSEGRSGRRGIVFLGFSFSRAIIPFFRTSLVKRKVHSCFRKD